jgi:hypothetical protein
LKYLSDQVFNSAFAHTVSVICLHFKQLFFILSIYIYIYTKIDLFKQSVPVVGAIIILLSRIDETRIEVEIKIN